jgi:hypothetical protein
MTSNLYPGEQPQKAPPLTSAAKRAISEAIEESRMDGSGALHSGHLLLGIAAEFDEPAGAQLRARGFDIPRARALLAELTIHPGLEAFTPTSNPEIPTILTDPGFEPGFSDTITIIVDSERVPAVLIAELMASFDALHRSWGGAGLEIDTDAVVSFNLPASRR